mmetsp:Transcript_41762/g.91712  ORF Transcript_41762/g.91712 Transcript_41762/m.91712 type:complete len:301 (-) Transcript_41762:368-1270(-)
MDGEHAEARMRREVGEARRIESVEAPRAQTRSKQTQHEHLQRHELTGVHSGSSARAQEHLANVGRPEEHLAAGMGQMDLNANSVDLCGKHLSPEEEDARKNKAIASLLAAVLRELGEDPSRVGLLDTPMRAAKALRFMTSGYQNTLAEVTGSALFPLERPRFALQPDLVTAPGLVVVKDIVIHSLCEHHLLPFFGRAHIGYLPSQAVLGLSKLARIADMFARRLQLQEQLTQQIADALNSVVQPRGVAVVLECTHMCMCARGCKQAQALTRTSALSGLLAEDASLRQEFMLHIAQPNARL